MLELCSSKLIILWLYIYTAAKQPGDFFGVKIYELLKSCWNIEKYFPVRKQANQMLKTGHKQILSN